MADNSQSPEAGDTLTEHGPRRLELLAPSDDALMLQAALDAGPDAVEFSGPELPARRPARNFAADEFRAAVRLAHERGVRVRLALDGEVAEDDVRQAAGLLAWARECGVDAVLVRDPALLALRTEYPELDFHLQASATNSADVAAAGELGASRCVLGRELGLADIAAASAVAGVATEVCPQAAIGGCGADYLLPDWIGDSEALDDLAETLGRTHHRRSSVAFPLPALAPVYPLDDLRGTGVGALRIESGGQPAWRIRQAVEHYRRGLSGEASAGAGPAAEAGQPGSRPQPAGEVGSVHRALEPVTTAAAEAALGRGGPSQAATAAGSDGDLETYELQILVAGRRIDIRCACREHVVEWSIPKSVVRRPQKAVSVEALLRYLQAEPIRGHRLVRAVTDDLHYLLVPRASNNLMARVSTVIHQALKRSKQPLVRDLPAAVEQLLQAGDADPANHRTLTDPPDRVRLHADDALRFLDELRPDGGAIVEGLTAQTLREVHIACRRGPLIVALPPVFLEGQIPEIEELLQACRRLRAIVEINSWGAWWLARQAGVRLESGPALSVWNSLAARALAHLGVQCVTLSVAATRKQLEDFTKNCPVSCSLVVFGRPRLLTRCAELPGNGGPASGNAPAGFVSRREGSMWVLCPQQPFDLRGCRNPRIGARHLVVDLIGSPDPLSEWQRLPGTHDRPFRFNYDRLLRGAD